MNNLYPLEASDMIYLLLDGELDASQSEVLFNALAQDEELRSVFNDTVAMSRAVSTDARSIEAPPPNVSAIFASAGIASTSLAATAAKASVSLWSRSLPIVVSAMVASLLTFVITKGFFVPSPSAPVSLTSEQNEGVPSSALISSVSPSVALGAEARVQETARKSNEEKAQVIQQHNYYYIVDREESPATTQTIKQQEQNIEDVQLTHPLITTTTPMFVQERLAYTPAPVVENPDEQYPLLIQLRSVGGSGFANAPGLLPHPRSGSNNIALAVYSKSAGGNMTGIEIGQEEVLNFNQAYSEGKERFATITYAGIAYRLALRPESATTTWHPFSQAMVGFSQIGALLKVSAGIEWQPLPLIGVVGGIESTLAQYWYNGYVQASNKTGIYTGLLFHLY